MYNFGCDTLKVNNIIPTDISITVSSTILNIPPYDSTYITAYYNPANLSSSTGNINIISNVGNESVCTNGIVEGSPSIILNPDSIYVSLNCNEQATIPFTILNNGDGLLNYNIQLANGYNELKVLAWTYNANTSSTGEYTKTLEAINSNFTNYSLTETSTSNTTTFANNLLGKDVLLIPENTANTSVLNNMQSQIQAFVNNGGWVIQCGNSSATRISSNGLLYPTSMSTTTAGTQIIEDPTSKLLDNTTLPIVCTYVTYRGNFSDPNFKEVTSISGRTVVGYEDIGLGKAIYIGYDYFTSDNNSERIISNAFNWAFENKYLFASTTITNGSLLINDSIINNIVIESNDLTIGTHNMIYEIQSNATQGNINLPITIEVIQSPNIWLSDTCLNLDTLTASTSSNVSIQIANTGCSDLVVNSITYSSADITHFFPFNTINENDTSTINFTYNATNIGVISETVFINTNIGNYTLCVNGFIQGASDIDISGLNGLITLKLCEDSLQKPFYIHNPGQGILDWSFNSNSELSVYPSSGNILPGDSTLVSLTLTLNNLIFSNDLLHFNTNVPTNSSFYYPIQYQGTNDPCVDFTYQTNANCNGIISFNDNSSGSVMNSYWNFGDGNTSVLSNPTHNYLNSGNYTVEYVACGNNLCDTTSQNISVNFTNSVLQASCYPNAFSSNSAGISNVTLENINNTTSINLPNDYEDFSCSIGTQLLENVTYTISVQTTNISNKNVKAWIDFNNNGTFEVNERIMNASNLLNHSASFTIPSGSSILNTNLRMRVVSSSVSNPVIDACSTTSSGQIEDYYINVLQNALPPIANFTSTPIGNCDGEISFQDLTTNNPTNWLWNFGDGNTSNIQNPSHQYNSEGTYDVQLIATNIDGLDTISTLTIVTFFEIDFSVSGDLFTDSTLTFPIVETYSAANSWFWNFGDNGSSALETPDHSYSSPQTYTVILTAENSLGCTDEAEQTISIIDKPNDPVIIDTVNAIINLQEDFSASLYPNPNDGDFIFEYEGNSKNLNLSLYSISGKLILVKSYELNKRIKVEFKNKSLTKGIYYLEMMDNKHTKIFKIIIK
ncbi:MAG: PKD domain-containing protein [Chitinophagales bacterium]